jgi:hypothetical protein
LLVRVRVGVRAMGASRSFDGCEGPMEVTALGLPPDVQRNVLHDNFLRLLGHSCP